MSSRCLSSHLHSRLSDDLLAKVQLTGEDGNSLKRLLKNVDPGRLNLRQKGKAAFIETYSFLQTSVHSVSPCNVPSYLAAVI